jgi:hypothetical protein
VYIIFLFEPTFYFKFEPTFLGPLNGFLGSL